MKEYWLWTDEVPDSGFNDYGIFFGNIDENENEIDFGTITKIIFCTDKRLFVGDDFELWDDALTNDPRRIIKFLFDKEYY